jgi:hypothetical protein
VTVGDLKRVLDSLPPGSDGERVYLERRGRRLPIRAAVVVPGDAMSRETTRVVLLSSTVFELPDDGAPDDE